MEGSEAGSEDEGGGRENEEEEDEVLEVEREDEGEGEGAGNQVSDSDAEGNGYECADDGIKGILECFPQVYPLPYSIAARASPGVTGARTTLSL